MTEKKDERYPEGYQPKKGSMRIIQLKFSELDNYKLPYRLLNDPVLIKFAADWDGKRTAVYLEVGANIRFAYCHEYVVIKSLEDKWYVGSYPFPTIKELVPYFNHHCNDSTHLIQLYRNFDIKDIDEAAETCLLAAESLTNLAHACLTTLNISYGLPTQAELFREASNANTYHKMVDILKHVDITFEPQLGVWPIYQSIIDFLKSH